MAQTVWKKLCHAGILICSPFVSGILWIILFGGSVVMIQFAPTKTQEEKDEDEANPQEATIRRNERFFGLLTINPTQFKDRLFRNIFQAKDALRPLFGVTLVLYSLFRLLHSKRIVLPDVSDFEEACPESGRRTQSSAMVKLLAASVTTVGIHGHLGSLSGSHSWRRELFRAAEVVACPLAGIYTFGIMVWVEIADIFSPLRSFWTHPAVGTRYRLARMCLMRIQADGSAHESRITPYLESINPEHIEPCLLRFDLRWTGRTIILVVLLGQYVQAFLLLSRRFMTKTSAMADVAMLLMVLSGGTALLQSLAISFTNTAWIIRGDTTPCVARSCMRIECMIFKTETNRPNASPKLTMLGFNVTGFPRIILNEFIAGYLQFQVVAKVNHTLWEMCYTVIGLYALWRMTIYSVLSVDLSKQLATGESKEKDPSTIDTQRASDSEVLPTIQDVLMPDRDESELSIAQRLINFKKRLVDALPMMLLGGFFFAVGCVVIAFGLFCIVGLLFYLLVPWIYMYTRIFQESGAWRSWNATEPCPMMWKDSLEDELWWF